MGKRVLGALAQQLDDRCIQLALFRQSICSSRSSVRVGKLAEPQQVAGFFEVRVVGEFVDVDAAIGENAPIAVDVANA